jgi:hypothetical protein
MIDEPRYNRACPGSAETPVLHKLVGRLLDSDACTIATDRAAKPLRILVKGLLLRHRDAPGCPNVSSRRRGRKLPVNPELGGRPELPFG